MLFNTGNKKKKTPLTRHQKHGQMMHESSTNKNTALAKAIQCYTIGLKLLWALPPIGSSFQLWRAGRSNLAMTLLKVIKTAFMPHLLWNNGYRNKHHSNLFAYLHRGRICHHKVCWVKDDMLVIWPCYVTVRVHRSPRFPHTYLLSFQYLDEKIWCHSLVC